jgi:hypothetical protein
MREAGSTFTTPSLKTRARQKPAEQRQPKANPGTEDKACGNGDDASRQEEETCGNMQQQEDHGRQRRLADGRAQRQRIERAELDDCDHGAGNQRRNSDQAPICVLHVGCRA